MKIAIVSALFPPDIAVPAAYVKELATRLTQEHTITVLLYNHLPEHIDEVQYVVIEKSKATIIRIVKFTRALWKIAQGNDVVLVQNGAATELPLILVSLFIHKKLILVVSDPKAIAVHNSNWLLRSIYTLASLCAYKIIISGCTEKTSSKMYQVPFPKEKPEILPFGPYPTDATAEYMALWEKHYRILIAIL